MKTRSDFVSNSSSTSFLIGFREEQLTQKQKDAIVEFISNNVLGQRTSDEEFAGLETWYPEEDCVDWARSLREQGWNINAGEFPYEFLDDLGSFLQRLWRAIAKADPENTKLIDIELAEV